MKKPKNIVITGANSGLGAALARAYAARDINLHLHGRNEERLADIATYCRARGATVHTYSANVTDREAMSSWLLEADRVTPIDLVIANAGISAGTGGGGESADQVRDIFATNIDGKINTVQPLIPAMLARGCGQIALVSSLAGIHGLPSSPAYSASKGCIRLYGEGLRGWLGKHGIEVNVICPGYIKTPMTDVNDFPMPFIMEADKAASIIISGLARNRSRIAFPRFLYWPLWLISCLPASWTDPFFARLPAKPSATAQATSGAAVPKAP